MVANYFRPATDDHCSTTDCAGKSAPCPICGALGTRKRILVRYVRTICFGEPAWRKIIYGEYAASCSCSTTFRNSPDDVIPKALYDDSVRKVLLDRIIIDRMSVERAIASVNREYCLDLSVGFAYDVLYDAVAQLDLAARRRQVLQWFSGTLCVDELHLGKMILLLATDPLKNMPVAFALVSSNDKAHMWRFLNNLKTWGLQPRVVITDGSFLYPETIKELWPEAEHQLCLFHIMQDICKVVLEALRRLRTKMQRQGNKGRRSKRGRKGRNGKGPTLKEKSAFIFKNRFLITKRRENMTPEEQSNLATMISYLPELEC